MEPFTQIADPAPGELKLTQSMIDLLIQTTKWTRFLAVMGYVMVGFMVLLALFMLGMDFSFNDAGIGSLSAGVGASVYLIIALVYFFPVHYLYQFSSSMKQAVLNGDERLLESAFEFLRKHYAFIGIMTVIALIFYAIIFVFGIVAGALFAAM